MAVDDDGDGDSERVDLVQTVSELVPVQCASVLPEMPRDIINNIT